MLGHVVNFQRSFIFTLFFIFLIVSFPLCLHCIVSAYLPKITSTANPVMSQPSGIITLLTCVWTLKCLLWIPFGSLKLDSSLAIPECHNVTDKYQLLRVHLFVIFFYNFNVFGYHTNHN